MRPSRLTPPSAALALFAVLVAMAGVAALPTAVGVSRASAANAVTVLDGSSPEQAVFPNDRFTVADGRQLSGRRVKVPSPACGPTTYSPCDAVAILNRLDGFDLQPRVSVPFSGPVQLDSVNSSTVYVEGPDGRTGLRQIVSDPVSHTVTGNTTAFLREDTPYTVVVTKGVLDTAGHPIDPCGNGCAARRTTFTTMSGTTELDGIRRALDDRSAYRQAGIADGSPSFAQGGLTTVFNPAQALGIKRNDQTKADPNAPLTTSTVPNFAVAGVGCYAFGSLQTPQFANSDAVIPQVPTKRTPPALSAARIGFAMILPAGVPPTGGWPVAVYGPGFTRSYFDLFVTADQNAARGIATVATDPLGHGFGPNSSITVSPGSGPSSTFLSYGRGHDADGDGVIGDSEGVQPSDHKTVDSSGHVVSDTPSHNALVGLRDGLIQSTADNMALVRAVEGGINVPSCGTGGGALARNGVQYYGLSFGGIYGTMLMGTDPHVADGLLNVPGGPIVDIARLSSFRDLLAQQLAVSRPSLLNGGPGRFGFTESLPLPNDPRVTQPVPGAVTLQRYLAAATWAERPGGPETYAPLIRLRPRYAPKTVAFQTAFGDDTVPNFTAGNIYRAGHLFDRVTYYRNDQTPSSGSNPHGFLADPTLFGRGMAETQLTEFLASRGQTVLDPDGPLPVFEVPITDTNNLQCLHYPDPQTGSGAYPPPAAGPCPPPPAEPSGHPAAGPTGNGSPGATGGGSTGGSGAAGTGPSGAAGPGSAGTPSGGAAAGVGGPLASTRSTAMLPLAALGLLLAAVALRRLRRRVRAG